MPVHAATQHDLSDHDACKNEWWQMDRLELQFWVLCGHFGEEPEAKSRDRSDVENEHRPGFYGAKCQRAEHKESNRQIAGSRSQRLDP
jgi:hypothetical protein